MKSVAIFNNKGGVGKTTLLANLASFLALQKKRRVLIVDADPQCNVTQLMYSDEEVDWPAPGSEDTELGVLMELEVDHGTTEVYAGVQA